MFRYVPSCSKFYYITHLCEVELKRNFNWSQKFVLLRHIMLIWLKTWVMEGRKLLQILPNRHRCPLFFNYFLHIRKLENPIYYHHGVLWSHTNVKICKKNWTIPIVISFWRIHDELSSVVSDRPTTKMTAYADNPSRSKTLKFAKP